MNANAVNMAEFTAPKSDQLNADDLIGGPRTITVTGVRANAGSAEQPVDIAFDGDNGKPYKPCKSMRRVMVHIWGADAKNYIGRSMTLYCDPSVQFGGMKVGGIRISHMSHMDKPQIMALTATRAKRAPFTVQPLVTSPTDPSAYDVEKAIQRYSAAQDAETFEQLEIDRAARWKKVPTEDKPRVKAASDAAKTRIEGATSAQETSTATEGAAS